MEESKQCCFDVSCVEWMDMSRFEAELFCHPLSDCIIPNLDRNQSKRLEGAAECRKQ